MDLSHALAGFAVVAALLTIVPGIDTALVIRAAIAKGPATAVATGLGISSGTLVWGLAAALGVSAVLAASELAYRILAVAGACYMAWLGGSLLWQSFRRAKPAAADAAAEARPQPSASGVRTRPAPRALAAAWLQGLGTNLLNPKVGVFYVATIPQFMAADVPPALMGAMLAGVHAAMGMAWFGILIGASALASRRLADARVVRWLDRITGGVLLGMGGTMLAQTRLV